MIDYSVWMTDFLSNYFKKESAVTVMKNDGLSLFVKDSFFHIVFAQGVFVELKPGNIYLYAKEFFRVLKPGGFCVFDYYNCENEDGWKFFVDQSNNKNTYFTFYPDDFIEKCLIHQGLYLRKELPMVN
ncbi:MAG: class I SAM-dependent methyltransferase [Bacteroidota bacterium]|nr:class I SAM-dependent methyltransferase [Bacteroidota bacterium]